MIQNYKYANTIVCPHWGQFVIENGCYVVLLVVSALLLGYFNFPFRWLFHLALLLFFLYLLYRYKYITSIRYCIGDEQLMVEHGIIDTRRDYMEMYRVVDYDESRTFAQRIFGLKTVSIYSCDRTRPRLDIKGINVHLDLVAIIRERVEFNKKLKGVYEITNR